MEKIKLSQGKFALVDDEDYEWLSQWEWCYHPRTKNKELGYAVRSQKRINGERGSLIRMHRVILNTPEDREADHINGDGLDNQRNNLRICTNGQNQQNQHALQGGASKFKGVCWSKSNKKWVSYITKDQKRTHLGYFNIEEDAAKSYNKAAIELFGEFARLNEI